jgi:pseudaminic acid synthase
VNPSFSIDDRTIGFGFPPYIVAELSANHNGSLDRALEIIEMASSAGANAVKIQTYTPDTITIKCSGKDFRLTEGLWAGQTLYDLYEKAHTPWDWHHVLFDKARDLGITLFSSPFDKTAVDFLEQFDPPAYKIASFELVDIPLIEHVAKTGKPVILSTGMASASEIDNAIKAATAAGSNDICLLHCVSGYPADPSEMNLQESLSNLKKHDVVTGLSDHTIGTAVSVAAVALGACLIEKHVTLKRADGGLDSAFSLEQDDLIQLIGDTDTAYQAVSSSKRTYSSESPQRPLRRSIYAVSNIKRGESFSETNVRSIRPGGGLPPSDLPYVLGQIAVSDIPRGTPMSWGLVLSTTVESDREDDEL